MIFESKGNQVEIDLLCIDDFITKINRFTPTQKLVRIQQFLASRGIAVTLSAAYQIWRSAAVLGERWRMRSIHHAEIAYWYGVDPFNLSEVQRLGLKSNLNRVLAQQLIFNGGYDQAAYNEVYALYKTAYDDEDLAQKKKTEAFREHMKRDKSNSK